MSSCDDQLRRVHLFGLDFVDARSVEDVADVLLEVTMESRTRPGDRLPVVVTPNVDHLVKRHQQAAGEAPDVVTEQARFILPDGQPIVWASRLLRRPLRTRLAGSSLVSHLWPRLVEADRRAFVVASSKITADRIRSSGDSVEVLEAPLIDLQNRSELSHFLDVCTRRAVAHNAEFVFVTIGYPKSNAVISGMLERWPAEVPCPLFLAVGASFEMHYGLIQRAPEFVQRVGMEWFFRLMQEPRRLSRRYLIEDPVFLVLLWREWRSSRR